VATSVLRLVGLALSTRATSRWQGRELIGGVSAVEVRGYLGPQARGRHRTMATSALEWKRIVVVCGPSPSGGYRPCSMRCSPVVAGRR
jgi:hypothetical protein